MKQKYIFKITANSFGLKINNTKNSLTHEEYDFNQHYLMSDALQFNGLFEEQFKHLFILKCCCH